MSKRERDAEIVARHRGGESTRQLAASYALTQSHVRVILAAHGVPSSARVTAAEAATMGRLRGLGHSVRSIAEETQRAQDTVARVLRKLGMPVERPTPLWSAAHDAALRERWPKESAAEIAATLRRTRNSVIGRAHRLGLRKRFDAGRPRP